MSAGSTTVKYGDITFTNCLTKRFEQEAVFDDSGTDLLYYKFTIRIVGWVHGRSNISSVNIIPITSLGSAAVHHRKFRPVLLEPRKSFEMRLGKTIDPVFAGQELLLCAPATTQSLSGRPETTKGKDLNNGPKAKILSVANIAADELIKVEAEFEICKLECGFSDEGAGNNSGVLNNRWSCIDDVDHNFYTTRTFTGRLRLSTSLVNPHSFRDWVVPGMQEGMKLEKMSFTASEDGLNLDYTVIHKEVAFSAPAPATDWRISHTESLGEFAMIGYAEISITLNGDRNVDKGELLAIAASVIEAKLVTLQGDVERELNDHLILAFTITDTFGSDQNNSVHVYCKVRHVQEVNETFPLAVEEFSIPIDASVIVGYDSNISRGTGEDARTEGPIPMMSAFATYLQSPCNTRHGIQAAILPTARLDSGVNKAAGIIRLEARVVPELRSEHPEYMSEGHKQNMYTYYEMDNTYDIRGHKVQLPIASGPSTSSADDDKPTSVTVILTNPTAKRIVRIKAERAGDWPLLPTPKDFMDENGIKVELLDHKIVPGTPERGPDGIVIHRINAEYIYALSRPPRPNEKLRVGFNPWDVLGVHTTPRDLQTGGTP